MGGIAVQAQVRIVGSRSRSLRHCMPFLLMVVLSTTAITMFSSASGASTMGPSPSAMPATSSGGASKAITVDVTGSPLSDMSSSSLPLTPAFSPTDTDYVWYCAAGKNKITLSLASTGTISVGSRTGPTISIQLSVVNNQAVIVAGPGGTDYWIRCLPALFPHLTIGGDGTASPNYYVTESFRAGSDPGYSMILNSYGTPVWYEVGQPGSGQDTELLPGTHTVAWAYNKSYYLDDLDTRTVTPLVPPVTPGDGHELFVDTSGDKWLFSTPTSSGYNLKSIGFPRQHNIVDCVVQELNPSGQLIWKWTASDYVSPDETDKLADLSDIDGVSAVDVYHCNSIDVDPENPNNVLVSMRHVGVFLIDKASKAIEWKLGGTDVAPLDGEPVLVIDGDPESTIQGQHDARFQPNGDVSIFDDHTGLPGAARGVEYTIDSTGETATMDWMYVSPAGRSSNSMGSVRRYDVNSMPYDEAGTAYEGPDETVVNWGKGAPDPGFVVLNSSNDVVLSVELPSRTPSYRTQMVPLSALNLTELRHTAGTAVPTNSAVTREK
jgi:hypothetical protein